MDDAGDRTVHACSADGAELVRYDRAGRWWEEWQDGGTPRRQRVDTVAAAVRIALHWEESGGDIFLYRHGGLQFDSKVQGARQKTARQR